MLPASEARRFGPFQPRVTVHPAKPSGLKLANDLNTTRLLFCIFLHVHHKGLYLKRWQVHRGKYCRNRQSKSPADPSFSCISPGRTEYERVGQGLIAKSNSAGLSARECLAREAANLFDPVERNFEFLPANAERDAEEAWNRTGEGEAWRCQVS